MGLNTTKPKRQDNQYYELNEKSIEKLSSIERVTSSESEPSICDESNYQSKFIPQEKGVKKPRMKKRARKSWSNTPEPMVLSAQPHDFSGDKF